MTQDQSIFILAFVITWGIGAFAILFPVQFRAIFQQLLKSLDFTQVRLVLAAVLLVIDVALFLVAQARFRRARLILD